MFKPIWKALACTLALSAMSTAMAADPVVIKFSHVVAEQTPKAKARCCSKNSWKNGCQAK